ncbi:MULTISPECIES: heme ABC transporter ATP-binding protein [Rhodomicrobium]|uniref:heme ABC transporter ATP-binding protein n=1 Tax=Rhodomicrobium TaxID=1068 RepID=UPI000B4BEB3B|nr:MULTISPECIES: heme ABC transporter ATP-binding protein [Rhodomicrobium]
MAMELKRVTVIAGRARLIQDVSLTLAPGKLTIILGANGAGKSTALNVLAGDLRPAEGEVLLDGRPLAAFSARELATRRAVVLQHAPMNFALCVHEVVALARAPFGSAVRSDHAEERAIRTMELTALAARDYSTLSGGERQRAQIARALAQLWHAGDTPPTYLMMDEPTAHLDLKHQITALEAARHFADAGGGALCILHDIALAREFADEIVLMKEGRLIASGPAAALLTPAAIADIYGISDSRARRLAAAWTEGAGI